MQQSPASLQRQRGAANVFNIEKMKESPPFIHVDHEVHSILQNFLLKREFQDRSPIINLLT